MRDLKKSLRVSGIVILVCIIFNIGLILSDIFTGEFSLYYIIIDSISIILTLYTGITYIYLSRKERGYILTKRKLFFYVSLLNIFNNVIIWGITVYVNVSVNNHIRAKAFQSIFNNKSPVYVHPEEQATYTPNESNTVEIINPDIDEMKNRLKSRLDELSDMKQKGIITEEEYLDLRNKAIKEFIK